MFFSQKEEQIMSPLFRLISDNPNAVFRFELTDNSVVTARLDTCYETNNGYEDDERGFEEYFACLFKIEEIVQNKARYKKGDFIEINYHNFPKSIKII